MSVLLWLRLVCSRRWILVVPQDHRGFIIIIITLRWLSSLSTYFHFSSADSGDQSVAEDWTMLNPGLLLGNAYHK